MVGGLVFSQTLTLYITPIYYVYLDKLQHSFRNLFGRKRAAEELPERELEAAR